MNNFEAWTYLSTKESIRAAALKFVQEFDLDDISNSMQFVIYIQKSKTYEGCFAKVQDDGGMGG